MARKARRHRWPTPRGERLLRASGPHWNRNKRRTVDPVSQAAPGGNNDGGYREEN